MKFGRSVGKGISPAGPLTKPSLHMLSRMAATLLKSAIYFKSGRPTLSQRSFIRWRPGAVLAFLEWGWQGGYSFARGIPDWMGWTTVRSSASSTRLRLLTHPNPMVSSNVRTEQSLNMSGYCYMTVACQHPCGVKLHPQFSISIRKSGEVWFSNMMFMNLSQHYNT